jgi:hypothetical protein
MSVPLILVIRKHGPPATIIQRIQRAKDYLCLTTKEHEKRRDSDDYCTASTADTISWAQISCGLPPNLDSPGNLQLKILRLEIPWQPTFVLRSTIHSYKL